MNHKILFFSLLILVSSCQTVDKPTDLSKLSHSEIIKRVKNKDFPNRDTIIYKNEKGDIISTDSLLKIEDPENWTADWYTDKNGVVRELILREATDQDKKFQNEIQEAMKYEAPLELVDIDCNNICNILQNVRESDQEMRTTGEEINPEVDRQNLSTVISLIEKCGMPSLEDVNEEQMTTIWIVLQHGDHANRKKYLPLLEKAAKKGDLKATQIAMMKDRILMDDGEPQIYGTQVTKSGNEWVLYELADPETVNQRRAEIGFEPLQDYLSRWDIVFDVKQL